MIYTWSLTRLIIRNHVVNEDHYSLPHTFSTTAFFLLSLFLSSVLFLQLFHLSQSLTLLIFSPLSFMFVFTSFPSGFSLPYFIFSFLIFYNLPLYFFLQLFPISLFFSFLAIFRFFLSFYFSHYRPSSRSVIASMRPFLFMLFSTFFSFRYLFSSFFYLSVSLR